MLRFASLVLGAGLTTMMIAGCSQNGATGPAGPLLSGTLSGFVYLVKSNGDQSMPRNGIKVFIDGMADTMLTDSTGKWSVAGLETGTYTITYHKDGYGETKSVQLQFLGGGPRNLGIVYLVEAPLFHADSLAWLRRATRADSTNVQFLARVNDTTLRGPYRLLVILGRDSTLSSAPSAATAEIFVTASFLHGIDSASVRLTPANFAAEGFVGGDTLWAAAYAANAGTETSGYLDVTTGKTAYTCLNATPSNSVRIVVP
jgi:hypothetical protein